MRSNSASIGVRSYAMPDGVQETPQQKASNLSSCVSVLQVSIPRRADNSVHALLFNGVFTMTVL